MRVVLLFFLLSVAQGAEALSQNQCSIEGGSCGTRGGRGIYSEYFGEFNSF